MKKYIEFEECLKKYNEILKVHETLISEKERLFLATQPKTTTLDKISVEGGKKNNLFDNYLIQVEKKQLDQKIEESKKLVDTRYKYLKEKETELRNSNEWIDKIYVYRFLDKLPVKTMIHLIPYEEAQMYRILNEIKSNINGDYNGKF